MTMLSLTDKVPPGVYARDLMSIPIDEVEYTSSVTVGIPDLQKLIYMNSGSSMVLTIPSDATLRALFSGVSGWPDKAMIAAMQFGAGSVTFTAGSGVTFVNGTNPAISAQYQVGWARRRSANVWVVSGSIA